MKETVVVPIVNKLGLHARAAVLFVKTAGGFAASIWVQKDGQRVNGKSIMGLLTLAAARGSSLAITAEGTDAEEAVSSLKTLVESKFGEKE
jgi:phosphocarrier protein